VGRRNFAYLIVKIQQGSNYKLEHDNPLATFFAQIYGKTIYNYNVYESPNGKMTRIANCGILRFASPQNA